MVLLDQDHTGTSWSREFAINARQNWMLGIVNILPLPGAIYLSLAVAFSAGSFSVFKFGEIATMSRVKRMPADVLL